MQQTCWCSLFNAYSAPLPSTPVWERDFSSQEELVTEFARECRILRKGINVLVHKRLPEWHRIVMPCQQTAMNFRAAWRLEESYEGWKTNYNWGLLSIWRISLCCKCYILWYFEVKFFNAQLIRYDAVVVILFYKIKS